MEFKAEQKYAKISPTKVRPLILSIKSMDIEKALEVLPLVPKVGASLLAKVVKSAVANAVGKGFSVSDLRFKEIVVNEGPYLKRGRPVSRGMWHPYIRKTSHIRVVLQTKDKKEESLKTDSKKKLKESKTDKKSTVVGKENAKVISKPEKKSDKRKTGVKSKKSKLVSK